MEKSVAFWVGGFGRIWEVREGLVRDANVQNSLPGAAGALMPPGPSSIGSQCRCQQGRLSLPLRFIFTFLI